MTPRQVLDKIPEGKYSLQEIMDKAGCSYIDATQALHIYSKMQSRRKDGIIPQWDEKRRIQIVK